MGKKKVGMVASKGVTGTRLEIHQDSEDEGVNVVLLASNKNEQEVQATVAEHQMISIPDASTWKIIKDAYRRAKEQDGNLDDRDKELLERSSCNSSGFRVPFEVRLSPGKGRGVFVTESLPKGACVCEDRSGHFTKEKQWRHFLELLPRDLACDCVIWAYVSEYKEEEAVYLDLSECSFINHGKTATLASRMLSANSGKANLVESYHNNSWHMHASRDIELGEELLCDYDRFHERDNGLDWFAATWREYIGHDNIHDC